LAGGFKLGHREVVPWQVAPDVESGMAYCPLDGIQSRLGWEAIEVAAEALSMTRWIPSVFPGVDHDRG
jgi:hypothetical protein